MVQLLVRITSILCVALYLLLTHCVALHIDVPPLASYPRKLMPVTQMEALTSRKTEVVSGTKEMEAIMGGSLQTNEVKPKQMKGETRTKWEEMSEPSDLFTMDYRRVRKRQPIHNKSLPFP